ncbi:MAG TPA: hypothetical protein VGX68_29085 [Thermoanaerobaculia bacterium]|jgi:hypothetical protein|nr:hypothetical protein [Thermoanaerobaculia bacterium]
MRKLTYCVLCLALCLAAIAGSPTPAAADCHEGCCADAQQQVESYCASLGTSVRYFYCEEGYAGSCCAAWYDCYPPWQ